MTAKHKCSCDLTYFDHAPDCEARTLTIDAGAAALAEEAKSYTWGGTDQEAAELRGDYVRLHTWLTTHTKVDPTQNAVDAAINLLETARLMVAHLTPAVTHVLQSALSALQSAGVDVGNIAIVEPTHEPSLGLATTEQLLKEIRARGDVDSLTLEDEEGKRNGVTMAGAAQRLLDTLPPQTLSYKTVDES